MAVASVKIHGDDTPSPRASSGATDGAELLPWAVAQYLAWSAADPVSWKERMRNGAVYVIQGNRNPFVDHPEFAVAVFDPGSLVGEGEGSPTLAVRLQPNRPNPFSVRTTVRFELPRPERVTLRIHDVTGRVVRTLCDGTDFAAGSHALDWDGRDEAGAPLQAGLYFCQLEAGAARAARRMVLAR